MLSLKVMRASAPALAVSEKPYYDHAETSSQGGLIAAVEAGIEDGLSHDLLSNRWEGSNGAASTFPISDLLVLPNSFGTLYLGETFRTYLCVRNEASSAVREPSLRVEMQVGASDPGSSGESGRWHQLAHIILPTPTRYSPDPNADEGRAVWELPPGQPLETSLGYDIKDLGAHVLVCTVGYKSAVHQGGELVWAERSFRKFYKFSVDRSPISVRTKVHQPRHASSIYHPEVGVRGRVELEVQVQNVAGNGASLVVGGMSLKPALGWRWRSVDRPSLNGKTGMDDMWLFKGTHELLADGDIRQYLFTLTPDTPSSLTEDALNGGIDLGTSPDGQSIRGDALGHLDISWRMSLGEPGRLQTSQLVRRRVSTPPVTVPSPSTSGVKLDPRLRTRVTLQPSAIEALRRVRAGDVIELEVDVDVCDLSALTLPSMDADEQVRVGGENGTGEEGSDEDDDTPLSEIASSPRAAKRTTTGGERITVKRTLQLALQHCTIDPPAPAAPIAQALGEDGMSTPRKTPLPSRTSTPTISSALHKARLQANLSNLVRNTSLSSLRPRSSTDTDAGVGRSGTPQPPALPPKEEGGLGGAVVVSEKPAAERKEEKVALGTGVPWVRVEELYKTHLETHSQALTRSKGELPAVPASFLPTPCVQHLGTSFVHLPEVHLQMTMLKGLGNALHLDPTAGSGTQGAKASASLTFILEDEVDEDETIRLGPVRVVLLGWKDEWLDEQGGVVKEERRDEMTVLEDVLVLAETLVSH